MYLRQDYVCFIPPPPHHRGTHSAFSPSIDACWYGRVNLIFKIRVRTDAGPDTRPVMECQCSLIETLSDYCPREGRNWYPSTAQIGTKLLYMPSPNPVVLTCLRRSAVSHPRPPAPDPSRGFRHDSPQHVRSQRRLLSPGLVR